VDPLRMSSPPTEHGILHPQYSHYFDAWRLLRDSVEGERAIKSRSQTYLPTREGQDLVDYKSFLERAVYYPATARTVEGFYGSIFRRPTSVTAPASINLLSSSFGGETFLSMVEDVVEEVLIVGRIGLLVDLPVDAAPLSQPYVETYVAENILNWTYHRNQLRAVKLLEYAPSSSVFQNQAPSRVRLLALDENGEYFQSWKRL